MSPLPLHINISELAMQCHSCLVAVRLQKTILKRRFRQGRVWLLLCAVTAEAFHFLGIAFPCKEEFNFLAKVRGRDIGVRKKAEDTVMRFHQLVLTGGVSHIGIVRLAADISINNQAGIILLSIIHTTGMNHRMVMELQVSQQLLEVISATETIICHRLPSRQNQARHPSPAILTPYVNTQGRSDRELQKQPPAPHGTTG